MPLVISTLASYLNSAPPLHVPQAALATSAGQHGTLQQQYETLQQDRSSLQAMYSSLLSQGDEALSRLEGLIAATRSSRQQQGHRVLFSEAAAASAAAGTVVVQSAAAADGTVLNSSSSSSRLTVVGVSSGSPSVLRSPSMHNRSSPQPIQLSAAALGRASLIPPPTGRMAAQRPPTPDRYVAFLALCLYHDFACRHLVVVN